ncbi:LysR substrate-binding domain-containing protein [Microvirga lotononidis]|uniref:Transcriptional regulator n=1 Tax=Microvirga lotononidis TaxID=864069 RepID=I4YKJ7_9HYPH|nr:LysR substrate-binding domain-containing protein [Microvirga lotononidis]EIM24489.1 transcriptional regulator [Microvirga lotononidis]WQO26514.1 LysR substrate-binding domain-containing protein [Microvirga lotononidis]
MIRPDLNDYAYFAEVVRHGGFSAASRALREPKSKLSRRIAELERRFGVRLIERSSRRFRVTDVGRAFYERCRILLLEAEQAEALVAEAQAEPYGLIRMSCPTGLVEVISGTLRSFLTRYSRVRVQLLAVDRPVDLIGERIDIALRVRTDLTSDAALTMRSLGISRRILVASPQLASRLGADIGSLADAPTLSTSDSLTVVEWTLERDDGTLHTLRHEPRITCGDFSLVRDAAVSGLGVALLPDHTCANELAAGRLVRVMREWSGRRGIVHLVFTTRRGLPPAVRALIDHLAAGFPRDVLERE